MNIKSCDPFNGDTFDTFATKCTTSGRHHRFNIFMPDKKMDWRKISNEWKKNFKNITSHAIFRCMPTNVTIGCNGIG